MSCNSRQHQQLAAVARRTPELHFEELDTQVKRARLALGGGRVQPGAFALTRHSNLTGHHVVFHLADSTQYPSYPALTSNSPQSPLLGGLHAVLTTADRFHVRTVTLPVFLLELLPAGVSLRSPQWKGRAEAVMRAVKIFLVETASRHADPSNGIKVIQLVLPPALLNERRDFSALLRAVFRINE